VKQILFVALILVSACRDQRPPTPTAEQNQQLNEADQMLNDIAVNSAASK